MNTHIPEPNSDNPIIDLSLKVVDLTLEEPRRWNSLLLHTLFSPHSVQEILKIPLLRHNFSQVQDKIKWTHHYSGNYSVKSSYATLVNTSETFVSDISWKKLWKLKIQDCLKLLIWKVARNILPTKSLFKTAINHNADQILCPLCETQVETLHHLFFNCYFARILWRQSSWPIDISKFNEFPITVWINNILNPSRSLLIAKEEIQNFQLFASLAMDCIWFLRNKVIHSFQTVTNSAYLVYNLSSFGPHISLGSEVWSSHSQIKYY